MKRFVLLLGVLLVMASCNQKQSVNPDKLVYLTDDNIPPLQTISFEQVDLPEDECMNSNFFVYDDSILIVCPLRPQTYCLTVMNINTKKIIGRYLPRGNGPGEVMDCVFHLKQNRLIVNETTRKLIIIDMDSLLLSGQAYKPAVYQTGIDIVDVDVLTDTTFLFSNIWYMDGCGNKVNEALPEFLVTGKDCQISFEVPEGASAVCSVNASFLLTNTNLQKVFIAYSYKPQFTLLNSNLDTLKVIYGPDPLIKKQKFIEIGGALFQDKISGYATGYSISTDSKIFMGSVRLYNIPRKEYREVSHKNQGEIYQFDWDGNMVARYQMEKTHKFIGVCGYSEKSGILYVEALDSNEEHALFKAQL